MDTALAGDRELNKTSLNPIHQDLGGALVAFGGWQMPLWYKTGAIKEHLAVVTAAGLFDTGHMSVIMVQGAKAAAFLNYALSRDISALKEGRAAYSVILDEHGFCLDDTIVYPLGGTRYGLVVNAGMAGPVIKHFASLPGADKVEFADLTGRLAKIDIQGPSSFRILEKLTQAPVEVFSSFPYFSFKGDFQLDRSRIFLAGNIPVLLSRSGYTGERGFEIFLAPDKAAQLWSALLAAGKDDGLIPCGLAARDSLRTGAVLPLSHQDIGAWPYINNPWPWALPLNDDGTYSKDFMGRQALNPHTAEHTLPFVGFDPRKVDTHEARVFYQGEPVGVVLTAVADMAIARHEGKIYSISSPDRPLEWSPKGLVCGFIKVKDRLPDSSMVILKDSRRELKVEIRSDIRPDRSARKALS